MKELTINIDRCSWIVYVFYAVREKDVDMVVNQLRNIVCPYTIMREAAEHLLSGEDNSGLTYTNTRLKETVLVIGEATSPEEFFNSLTHETRHLEAHIAQALDLDPFGEEVCYIAGEIAGKLFTLAEPFLCQNHVASS